MESRATSSGEQSQVDGQLADLLAELAHRMQSGEQVDLDDYVRSYPKYAEQLEQFFPAMMTLADLGHTHSSVPSCTALAGDTSRPIAGELGDFRIIREIGRGGMGVVYEAEQVSLNRRVALKVLPFAAVLDQKQLQRFKNEAQAAASLKHPNIVVVYAVGCERGVHHYAMDYIEGRTLAKVIKELRQDSGLIPKDEQAAGAPQGGEKAGNDVPAVEFEGAPKPDASPSADTDRGAQAQVSTEGDHHTPEFFRSMARLAIQAAEGLEHAHQMGVVHRDVKPSNLMVDASGHLWITDFGLAMTQSETNLTMTGDVLGTLRYMSPEQAEGRHGILDHHTDIYSLGVTLYELLTLQPAFAGDDRKKLLRDLSDSDPRPPRQLNRSIPVDLETIVGKATSKEPKDRYASARELADDLQRFLDGKPIHAQRPTLLSRAAKWCRRHKAFVAAAAAMLVITSIGSVVSTVLIAKAAYREAKQAQLAEANVKLALQALDEIYVEVAAERLPQKARLSKADRSLLRKALRFYEALAKRNDTEPTARAVMAKAYRGVGDIQLRLGEYEEAETAYRRSIDGFQRLADKFPADSEPKYGAAASFNNLGTALWQQGRSEEAEQAYRRALDMSKTLCDRAPDKPEYVEELARSHNNLAIVLGATGLHDEAERAFLKARELWQQLAHDSPNIRDYRHRLAGCLANLGVVWMEMKRNEEAEETLAQSLEIGQKLVAEDSEQSEYQELLAGVQNTMGVLVRNTRGDQDAKSFFEDAILRWRVLAARFPGVPDYQEKLRRTSQNLLQSLDKDPDDETSLQEALALRRELVDMFPQSAGHRDELAKTHVRLAGLLTKNRRLPEAERSYSEAADLWEGLRAVSSDSLPYQKGLAQAYNRLGILRRDTGQTAAAAEAYRKAAGVMEELAVRYGDNPAFRESVAKTWHNLGLSLGTSQPEEAADALSRARGTFEELAGAHPDQPKYRVDLASGDTVLGSLLVTMGRKEDAEPLLREAVELRRALAEQFPDDGAHQNSLAWLLANCADPALRDPAGAVELAKQAVQRDPKRAASWNTLGAAHFRAGEWPSAIEALKKSIELGAGGDGSDWLFLAMAHWQLSEEDQARKCYDQAVEWIDQQRPHDAEMKLLRQEARVLLRGNVPDSQDKETFDETKGTRHRVSASRSPTSTARDSWTVRETRQMRTHNTEMVRFAYPARERPVSSRRQREASPAQRSPGR